MNEKVFIKVNGVKQGMFLQSEDIKLPVLLYLHGGPGSPEVAFNEGYPTGLEKLFTVCWWEQRGSGISYDRKLSGKEMTLKQLVADAIEVAKYLRKRFKKDKIYIMGHSWGSLLGVLTVKAQPELFHAYIGAGQLAQQEKSERLGYTYMIQEFTKLNDQKMLRKLRKYPIAKDGDISIQYLLGVRSEGMNKLGVGIKRSMTSTMDLIKPILKFKGYTLSEKFKIPKGSFFSTKYLTDSMLYTDLIAQVSELQVPVYIFHGRYDHIASYDLAKTFFMALKAPTKGFYTFENAAHSPCFEEPEKMWHILRNDVLQAQVSLADKII